MKYFIILAIIGFLLGCDTKPKDLKEFMVDITEFNINNEILEDGDYVHILGSSGNLTKDHEIDFYNLVVVKSDKTGDTINVLVTTFFQSDINNPRTNFISNSSDIGKVFEQLANGEFNEDQNVNDIEAKTFDKVFYDSEYIQVDVRKFPAVTGGLGDYRVVSHINE